MGKHFPTHVEAHKAMTEHKSETGHDVRGLDVLNGIVVSCSDCDAFEGEAEDTSGS